MKAGSEIAKALISCGIDATLFAPVNACSPCWLIISALRLLRQVTCASSMPASSGPTDSTH